VLKETRNESFTPDTECNTTTAYATLHRNDELANSSISKPNLNIAQHEQASSERPIDFYQTMSITSAIFIAWLSFIYAFHQLTMESFLICYPVEPNQNKFIPLGPNTYSSHEIH
jgi:hypothetical protein